jgi:ubiquinone biosynthesis O-methyltransferase
MSCSGLNSEFLSHQRDANAANLLTSSISTLLIMLARCGGGILAESLALEGAIVTGIDMAEAGLEVAKLHLLESGLTVDYQKISVEDFAKDNAQAFDIVTCLEMLEHVPDPSSIIKACSALVKADGQLFFSTLNQLTKTDKSNTTEYYVYDYQGNRVRSVVESNSQVQSQRDYLLHSKVLDCRWLASW